MMCWIKRHILTWRGLALGSMAALFWLWAFPVLAPALIPPSWYINVRQIYIGNVYLGDSNPTVTVDRDIRTQFVGGFVSQLYKIDDDGVVWTYCSEGERREITYRSGAPYPGHDLNWWLGSPPANECRLVPGTYKLRITWIIQTLFGLAKLRVEHESNVFNVVDAVRPIDPELLK